MVYNSRQAVEYIQTDKEELASVIWIFLYIKYILPRWGWQYWHRPMKSFCRRRRKRMRNDVRKNLIRQWYILNDHWLSCVPDHRARVRRSWSWREESAPSSTAEPSQSKGIRNNHKVHTYKEYEYHSVCPLVGFGTLPPSLSRGGEGLGDFQFQRLEKKLSTLLLCGNNCTHE